MHGNCISIKSNPLTLIISTSRRITPHQKKRSGSLACYQHRCRHHHRHHGQHIKYIQKRIVKSTKKIGQVKKENCPSTCHQRRGLFFFVILRLHNVIFLQPRGFPFCSFYRQRKVCVRCCPAGTEMCYWCSILARVPRVRNRQKRRWQW